jgi:hypothetical protein
MRVHACGTTIWNETWLAVAAYDVRAVPRNQLLGRGTRPRPPGVLTMIVDVCDVVVAFRIATWRSFDAMSRTLEEHALVELDASVIGSHRQRRAAQRFPYFWYSAT